MSAEAIQITVDARTIETITGTTVASALLNAGILTFRRSESGESRAPLCGMGVCYECRVTIDGVPHQRACMTMARRGMTVETTPTDSAAS